jgi:hypothetical protein
MEKSSLPNRMKIHQENEAVNPKKKPQPEEYSFKPETNKLVTDEEFKKK